jgi:hypothetical protein
MVNILIVKNLKKWWEFFFRTSTTCLWKYWSFVALGLSIASPKALSESRLPIWETYDWAMIHEATVLDDVRHFKLVTKDARGYIYRLQVTMEQIPQIGDLYLLHDFLEDAMDFSSSVTLSVLLRSPIHPGDSLVAMALTPQPPIFLGGANWQADDDSQTGIDLIGEPVAPGPDLLELQRSLLQRARVAIGTCDNEFHNPCRATLSVEPGFHPLGVNLAIASAIKRRHYLQEHSEVSVRFAPEEGFPCSHSQIRKSSHSLQKRRVVVFWSREDDLSGGLTEYFFDFARNEVRIASCENEDREPDSWVGENHNDVDGKSP